MASEPGFTRQREWHGYSVASSRTMTRGRTVTTSTRLQFRTTTCPDCGVEVRPVGRLMIGEVFGCGSCDSQLEVACTDPLILEPLAKVEEDEDDFIQ